MLVCKFVFAWGHDLSTNSEQAFNRRAGWQHIYGWQSCIVSSKLASKRCGLQTTERKRTSYEYQEGSVWYNWYGASFINI